MSRLAVENVSRSFSGLLALNRVSLTVTGGEILGLIGPNGAGKTTLFNAIAGNIPPTEGRILLDGEDITGMPPDRIARLGVGRTFQLMRPFASISVLDNVTIGAFALHRRRRAARRKAEELIARVGLSGMEDDRAGTLSTAGRKRLELARALALEPRFLLLDEVLSGLVPAEREPLLDLLSELRAEGRGLLFVEHVMAAVMRLSDRVVVLHHGEVLATGTPTEVAKNREVIDAYLGEEMPDA